jgi:hypothetical protein
LAVSCALLAESNAAHAEGDAVLDSANTAHAEGDAVDDTANVVLDSAKAPHAEGDVTFDSANATHTEGAAALKPGSSPARPPGNRPLATFLLLLRPERSRACVSPYAEERQHVRYRRNLQLPLGAAC